MKGYKRQTEGNFNDILQDLSYMFNNSTHSIWKIYLHSMSVNYKELNKRNLIIRIYTTYMIVQGRRREMGEGEVKIFHHNINRRRRRKLCTLNHEHLFLWYWDFIYKLQNERVKFCRKNKNKTFNILVLHFHNKIKIMQVECGTWAFYNIKALE